MTHNSTVTVRQNLLAHLQMLGKETDALFFSVAALPVESRELFTKLHASVANILNVMQQELNELCASQGAPTGA